VSGECKVRAAVAADIPGITRIYCHYVLTHTSTFEIDPPDEDEMQTRWRLLVDAGFPYLVAVSGDAVLGFCYIGPYRSRIAYRYTGENSVYLDPQCLQRGIGSALMRQCMVLAAAAGVREVVAVIGDSANIASIRLHENLGFRYTGNLRNVGYKFDRWLDTVIMQRTLAASPDLAIP
jgi:L-amino acid N-acyltransferase YncA